MARKTTKKEIQEAAKAVVNAHLAAGTADQIPLETIMATLPGGAGGEAQIYGCLSLKDNPGMTMEALQTDVCAEAELNFSTADWIVGREWGSHKGFGGMDFLWERRKEKLPGDRRARWRYYLLPAGETLAKADPRTNTRSANLARIVNHSRPGDLVVGRFSVFNGYSMANSSWMHCREYSSNEEQVLIATCYLGMVRGWGTDSAGNRVRVWDFLEATGPDHENWHQLMGSRQIFIGCVADGIRVAVPLAYARITK